MKKIVGYLMLAVTLSACGGSKDKSDKNNETSNEIVTLLDTTTTQEVVAQEESKKQIGDMVKVNGQLGIVFELTPDCRHGKVMSANQISCDWYDARIWCSNLGKDWRLPTQKELLAVYKNKKVVNSVLEANYFRPIPKYSWYWTSETFYDEDAWLIFMFGGDAPMFNKNEKHNVLAVACF